VLPKLPIVEFYITNVCNLTCDHCNRFNNYVFRGWQKWQDHEQDYGAWAQQLNFDQIVILGGEPLLNPTVLDWCQGIRALWPHSRIQLVSNGYHINRVAGLRDVLLQNRILLCVTVHDAQQHDFLYGEIDRFLGGARVKYQDPQQGYQHLVSDASPTGVWMQTGFDFVSSSLRRNDQGQLTLNHSDPQAAHANCSFVKNRTYHFIRGLLYKCGPVALLPEFDQQYPLAITAEDRELLNSYRPYSAQDFADRGDDILQEIQQPIPQCSFCPENYETHSIQARPKGAAKTINIIKRS
jgi:uncharacterized Fe-S cluster-containing radical SAM superfamily protein